MQNCGLGMLSADTGASPRWGAPGAVPEEALPPARRRSGHGGGAGAGVPPAAAAGAGSVSAAGRARGSLPGVPPWVSLPGCPSRGRPGDISSFFQAGKRKAGALRPCEAAPRARSRCTPCCRPLNGCLQETFRTSSFRFLL